MSATTTQAAIGTLLRTVAELDALPPFAAVLADPEGRNQYPNDRRLSMQKRSGEPGYTDFWYPAWGSDIFNALASEEAVVRFHLGLFAVLWLPPVEPDVEPAA